MTNIDILSEWAPDVQRYDTADPVLGGDAGESNIPIKQLANRTQYIYDRLWFRDIFPVTASTTITNLNSFQLISITAAANLTFTLDDVVSFEPGTVVGFICKNTAIKTHSIIPTGAQKIQDGNVDLSALHMCDGEKAILVAAGTHWKLLQEPANHYRAGEDVLVRKLPRNSVIAEGQLASRADYARVWAEVSGFAISDITWNSDPLRYKGFFSTGNTTSTFRFPDLRSMSFKALDLLRGLDFARLDSVSGGYEPDAIVQHYHVEDFQKQDSSGGSQPNTIYKGFDQGGVNWPSPLKTGGAVDAAGASIGASETRVKNIGKIPAIYY